MFPWQPSWKIEKNSNKKVRYFLFTIQIDLNKIIQFCFDILKEERFIFTIFLGHRPRALNRVKRFFDVSFLRVFWPKSFDGLQRSVLFQTQVYSLNLVPRKLTVFGLSGRLLRNKAWLAVVLAPSPEVQFYKVVKLPWLTCKPLPGKGST